jgi:nickel-type superoxide dismutase maturation protease
MPGSTEERAADRAADARQAPGRRDRIRVVVRDESMRPTLEPGDRLLVDRSAYRRHAPRTGEIVVLVDPDEPTRWLIKRVAATDAPTGTVEVRGDATEVARDSRRFGPVASTAIVGRAFRLYFPVARRRDL